METVNPLHGLAVLLASIESVRHVNPADDEYPIVLADLSADVATELSFSCINPARLQRASEGSR